MKEKHKFKRGDYVRINRHKFESLVKEFEANSEKNIVDSNRRIHFGRNQITSYNAKEMFKNLLIDEIHPRWGIGFKSPGNYWWPPEVFDHISEEESRKLSLQPRIRKIRQIKL